MLDEVHAEFPIHGSDRAFRVDILATSSAEDWIVEIKARGVGKDPAAVLWQVASYVRAHPARAWIIILDQMPPGFAEAVSQRGFLVSGIDEWEEIKRILDN